MTEDSLTDDGSRTVDEMLEDDSSAVAEDRTISDDDSSTAFGPDFPGGGGTGRGPGKTGEDDEDAPGLARTDEVDDEFSLGYRIVEDKDDTILPDFMAVTYDQANSWFDESFFGRPARDSSPGMAGKVISAVAHIPYLGESSSSDTTRARSGRTAADGGAEESRGPEVTRRFVLHSVGALGAGGVAAAKGNYKGDGDDGGVGVVDTPSPTDYKVTDGPTPTDAPTITPTPTETDTATATETATDTQTASPTPTLTGTTPTVTPSVEGEKDGLMRVILPETYFQVDNESQLQLGDTRLCYPHGADNPESQVVAAVDAGEVDSVLEDSDIQNLEPVKGTYGVDLDIVDVGPDYDGEPEYVAQLVGGESGGEPVYLSQDQWETLGEEVEPHEVWNECR